MEDNWVISTGNPTNTILIDNSTQSEWLISQRDVQEAAFKNKRNCYILLTINMGKSNKRTGKGTVERKTKTYWSPSLPTAPLISYLFKS